MTTRSGREAVTFGHLFRIRDIERLLPAGAYEAVTDEETIERLSFPGRHRVATMITSSGGSMRRSTELLSIGSVDLADTESVDVSVTND